MIVAFVIGDSMFGSATGVVKVLLAIGVAGMSYVIVIITDRPTPTAAGVVIAIVGAAAVLALVLLEPTPALAADVTWRDAVILRRALLGGVGAAVGAAVGAVLGGTTGVLAGRT